MLPPSEGLTGGPDRPTMWAAASPCCSCCGGGWGSWRRKEKDTPHDPGRFTWALLVVSAVVGYLALALNGGAVELLLRLNRWGGPVDIYSSRARGAHGGRAYALHPFQEMFWPAFVAQDKPRRSLAVFTAGRDGLANVDALVRAWGDEHFDFLVCHYDESQAEWAALPWYRHAVGLYAHRQGKMWFFKRALTPWLVQEYEYVAPRMGNHAGLGHCDV